MKKIKELKTSADNLLVRQEKTESIKDLVTRIEWMRTNFPMRDILYFVKVNARREQPSTSITDFALGDTVLSYLNEYFAEHWIEISEYLLKRANQDLVKDTKATKRVMLDALGLGDQETEEDIIQEGGQG